MWFTNSILPALRLTGFHWKTDRTVLIVTHRPRVREISDRVWEVE